MAERPAPDGDFATVVAERDAWRQAAFEAQTFAARTAIERQHLSDAIDAIERQALETARLRAAAAEAAAAFAAVRAELEAARARSDALAAECDRARIDARETAAMLERVTSSTAWRMTGPARRVLRVVLRR